MESLGIASRVAAAKYRSDIVVSEVPSQNGAGTEIFGETNVAKLCLVLRHAYQKDIAVYICETGY